jgi:outer membrane cobalamin receptor
MRTKLFACVAAASAATCGAAWAQAVDQTATSDSNPQVVVTGKRLEQELPTLLAQQGVRVDVVTAQTIKNGEYVDVTQALQTTVPGLYISPQNGPFDYVQVSLQGSRTEDVLWLVDGVRINNRLYAGTTPLDTLPASMIDRIDVVEGPQALFYGTESVAGAINIITKDFSDTLDGAVTVGGDTNDSFHADGFVRDTLAGNHFVLYASQDQSRGFLPYPAQDFQPSATQRDRAYDMWGVGGKYARDFLGDKLRVTLSEEHNQGRLDYAQPQLIARDFNDRNEDILIGKVDYTPSDKLQLYVKGYYHWWLSHYTEFDHSLTDPGTLVDVEDNGPWGFVDRGVNALAKVEPVPIVDLYVGYDFQNYYGSDAVLVITKHSESVNAVFGEVATTPAFSSNVTLAAGVRYNAPSVGQSATVGDVSARWDVTSDLYIKAMAGAAFRLPTAEELFANDPQDELGDPNLKPETSENLNISIGGKLFGLGALQWEAIGFLRDVNNLISYVSYDADTEQYVFGNLPGTVKVRGGEIILDGAITPELSASASYTYSPAREGGAQIAQIPLQLAKAMIDYHPADLPFGASASLNYVGQVYDNGFGAYPNVSYGDYVVINLQARVFLDRKRRHRIDLGVNNLFDAHYATQMNTGYSDVTGNPYPVPDVGQPRTFIARYTYHF